MQSTDANIAIRLKNISDSAKRNLDTIRINRQAIIDSSAHIRNNLRDTAATMRGLINANHSDIAANAAAINQLQSTDANIAIRLKDISDSAKRNLDTIRMNRQNISDSTRMVFDTLHTYYATKSAVASQLSNYTTTADLQTNYATKTNVSEGLDSVKNHIRSEIGALAAVKEYSKKYDATANQTTFTLPQTPVNTHLVRIYINGVMVGDNDNSDSAFPAVITVSGTTVTYIPANNGGYVLNAGDRVVIYYFK